MKAYIIFPLTILLPHIYTARASHTSGVSTPGPAHQIDLVGKNGHISVASNSALELVSREFIALLNHDDELAEHALYMAVEELNAHPETDLIYSDEDKIDETGRRFDPYFKSDWNPDLFLSQNEMGVTSRARLQVIENA